MHVASRQKKKTGLTRQRAVLKRPWRMMRAVPVRAPRAAEIVVIAAEPSLPVRILDALFLCVGESQGVGIRGMQPGAPLTPSFLRRGKHRVGCANACMRLGQAVR